MSLTGPLLEELVEAVLPEEELVGVELALEELIGGAVLPELLVALGLGLLELLELAPVPPCVVGVEVPLSPVLTVPLLGGLSSEPAPELLALVDPELLLALELVMLGKPLLQPPALRSATAITQPETSAVFITNPLRGRPRRPVWKRAMASRPWLTRWNSAPRAP
jgi:hypothetical protein